ncbi:MHYT domain-containing protein [Streptomyces sp. CBG31]|nr:MHYT domain-containing protein [Streptomyces sp. CBG31]
MHYTGMAALGVQLQPGVPSVVSADPPAD